MLFAEKIKTKIAEHISLLKTKMGKSETYGVVLPVLIACLFLLIFLPFLFDNSALQFQIEQKVSATLKSNLEIDGKVEVALLPSPSITVNDVVMQDFNHNGENYSFYAKQITVKLSFLSSLMGNFAVKKIIFSQAILQNYNSNNKPTQMQDEFTEIISHRSEQNLTKKSTKSGISGKLFVDLFKINQFNADDFDSTNFPKILVEKSSWISYDQFSNKKVLSAFNGEASFSKKKILAKGSFADQDVLNNFTLKARFNQDSTDNPDESNSSFELTSSYGNFKIIGVFSEDNLGFLKSRFKGKIEAEIFDLKTFYKLYVSRDGFIYNKINPATKPIKLKASISNEDSQIVVSNIFVNSNVINGRGDVSIDLSAKLPLIDVRLYLENIDLDAVWLSDQEIAAQAKAEANKATEEKEQNTSDTKNNNDEKTTENTNEDELASTKEDDEKNNALNIAKDLRDFDLTAEINVSRIKYLDEEIKNVSLYTTISKQGEIMILPLTLEVPGGGLFRMSGVLENGIVPKFIGSLDASGTKLADIFKWLHLESQNLIYENLKDYNLYADIFLIPNSTTLNNVYLNINGGKNELLGEVRVHYTTKSSSVLSNFRVNSLNVDDYFLTSGQNIYLSPGSLLKKLLWLNNLSSNNDLSISFDRLLYKNSVFNNQAVKLRFGQGYFEVSQLKLDSDDINLSASLSVDISRSDPKFDISVNAKNFSYKSSENIGDDKTKTKKITALDQFYALPSLEGFNGDISFNFDQGLFDDFSAQNTKIAGKLKDGIIDFSNFSSDIYGGNLKYTGVIGVKFDKAISGNVELTKANLRPLLSDSLGLKNIDGIANISASVESFANNRSEFFKNLRSSLKFGAVALSVENYGLNDLVKKMFNAANYSEELRDPEKILFNANAKTNFKKATGNLVVEKGRDSTFRIDAETIAANSIISGKLDLLRSSIDGTANIVFLTGNLKKQIPLNIATNLKGDFGNIRQSSNLDQVKQYLGLPYTPSITETKNVDSEIKNTTTLIQDIPSSNYQSPPQATINKPSDQANSNLETNLNPQQ